MRGDLGSEGALGASMRPRRVRRGNVRGGMTVIPGLRTASMRPRRVRRGNGRETRSSSSTTTRFNEAPACPPGKSVEEAEVVRLAAMLQ